MNQTVLLHYLVDADGLWEVLLVGIFRPYRPVPVEGFLHGHGQNSNKGNNVGTRPDFINGDACL